MLKLEDWETVELHPGGVIRTERAWVDASEGGGWLVRTWVYNVDDRNVQSVSIAFVPDPNRMWNFDRPKEID